MIEYNIEPITVESLRASSTSPEAQIKLASYYRARESKSQTLIICCGDSRKILPDNCPNLRSLAAGGPLDGYESILNNGVRNAAVLGHFDGDHIANEIANMEFTCAARNAKSIQLREQKLITNSGTFFEEYVKYPQLLLQTLSAAVAASELTDKSILAGVQNHLNGELIPLAVLKEKEVVLQKPMLKYLLDGKTILASNAYERFKDMAGLSDDEIPDEFLQFVLDTRATAEQMQQDYKDLGEKQKLHNPRMMVVSSNLKNPAVWLPMLREPGFAAIMNLPRVPKVQGSTFTRREYGLLSDQLSLLTHEANKNADKPDAPYSATKNLLVVRGDIELASETADHLLESSEDLIAWEKRADVKVFLAEVKDGRMQYRDYYNQAA